MRFKIKIVSVVFACLIVTGKSIAGPINISGCEQFPGGLLATIQATLSTGVACMQTGSVATKAEATALSAIFSGSQPITIACGTAGSTVTVAGKSIVIPKDNFGRAIVSPESGAPGMVLNIDYFKGNTNEVKVGNILFHEMIHWLNVSNYDHNGGYDSPFVAANACFSNDQQVHSVGTDLLKQTRMAGTQPAGYLGKFTSMILNQDSYTVYFNQYAVVFKTLSNAIQKLSITHSVADSAEIGLATKELFMRLEPAAKVFERARLDITPTSLSSFNMSPTIAIPSVDAIAVSAGKTLALMYQTPTNLLTGISPAATAYSNACQSLSMQIQTYINDPVEKAKADYAFNKGMIKRFMDYSGLPPICSGGLVVDYAIPCPPALTPATMSSAQVQYGLEKTCFCKMYVGNSTSAGYLRNTKSSFMNACSATGAWGTAGYGGGSASFTPSVSGNGFPWQGPNIGFSTAHPVGSGTWSGTGTPPPVGAVFNPKIPGGPSSTPPDIKFKNPYNGGACTRVGPNGTTLSNTEIEQLMFQAANNTTGTSMPGTILVSSANCPACAASCGDMNVPLSTLYNLEEDNKSCTRRFIDETHWVDTFYGVRQQ